MTEYSTTENKKKKSDKISDFAVICSLILSNPLYFSYLIFFSPYLFKLLCFLSPLFFTTSLLFLSLLTTFIPDLQSIINSKEGFFLAAYNTLLEKLGPDLDDEGEKSQPLEEFEVYKIIFERPIIEVMEENPEERIIFEENPVGFSEEKAGDQCESLTMGHETGDTKVKEEVKKYESIVNKSGSEMNEMSINKEMKPKGGSLMLDHEKKLSEAFSQTVGRPPYLGSFGSMRKEREWKRTLACMLFEERHNGGYGNINGGNNDEGMDLLWESHETEQNRGTKTEEKNRRKGGRREKNEGLKVVNDDEEDNYVGEEEDGDDDNGKFCCLQALKLSAGKMNLSMGRPNLIKIGKAFKGIGWLHSHAKRQGKKGYK